MKAADSLIGEVETLGVLLDIDGAVIDLWPTRDTVIAPPGILTDPTSAEGRLAGKAAA